MGSDRAGKSKFGMDPSSNPSAIQIASRARAVGKTNILVIVDLTRV